MIKAAVIAALAIPVLCASAADYSADLQKARTQADTWCNNLSRITGDLKELGVELPAPSAEYSYEDETVTDDTKIMSELGMIFDADTSRIIYLGNVRFIDRRLSIKAAQQLHIHLPGLSKAIDGSEADNPAAEATPGQVIDAATPAPEQAAEDPAAQEEESGYKGEPAAIDTEHAIADTISNTILLYAPTSGKDIAIDYGKNSIRIKPGEGSAPAPRLLADAAGNILLEGGIIHLAMVDDQGQRSELCTSGGHVYYHAATSTLHIPGKSSFNHPDGTLSCSEMLCVRLAPAAATDSGKKKGFMSQFTGLKFEGIDTASAKGQVVASQRAREDQPGTELHGDELRYNGKTGDCSLTGSKCRIVYGEYIVNANEGIHLLPNGDIELRGSDISGNYTRGGDKGASPIAGTFKANDNVIFRADLGTITTNKGITIADTEMDFSSEGPTHLVLARKPGAKVPEQKPGMPNLAIAQFGEIARAKASGNVIAHRYAPVTRKCIGELKADSVETDINTGETLITSAPGQQLTAVYNGNRVEATPAEGKMAIMEMQANGDIRLNGERISAVMLSDKGTTTARCRDYVRLIRAEDRLETGSATRINSEAAILTTRGPLSAKLTSDKQETQPSKGGSPIGNFNYTGIQEATTNSGCTVQTEKGSMQCTGPVRLTMDTSGKGQDKMLGGIKRATARGNVAVAGKDSTGRMLRATGDFLEVDAASGMKVLKGKEVTLADANNTHVASGEGAAISIDANNNASITGARHTTHATNIKQQIEQQKSQKSNQ